MTKPARRILDNLENIRENLLAFSKDVWLEIDHNYTQTLEEGLYTLPHISPIKQKA